MILLIANPHIDNVNKNDTAVNINQIVINPYDIGDIL